MSSPLSNPTNTLVVNKSLSDVNEAIAFIPALSLKYKLVQAIPSLQQYTFSGEEPSSDGVYIDVRFISNEENNTEVTLAVRRKIGAFQKSSDITMANQHLNTLANLLSDSLRLEPDRKSRLVSIKRNEQTAGDHRTSQAFAQTLFSNKKQSLFQGKNTSVLLMYLFVLAVLLYVLYRYFVH